MAAPLGPPRGGHGLARRQRRRAARDPWYVLITTGSPALTGLAVFFNVVPAVLAAGSGLAQTGRDPERLDPRRRAARRGPRSRGRSDDGSLAEGGKLPRLRRDRRRRHPASALGILLGGLAVGTLGVAATLLVIGLCFLTVTGHGFFNHAFREMDGRPEDGAGPCERRRPETGVRLRTRFTLTLRRRGALGGARQGRRERPYESYGRD